MEASPAVRNWPVYEFKFVYHDIIDAPQINDRLTVSIAGDPNLVFLGATISVDKFGTVRVQSDLGNRELVAAALVPYVSAATPVEGFTVDVMSAGAAVSQAVVDAADVVLPKVEIGALVIGGLLLLGLLTAVFVKSGGVEHTVSAIRS